MKRTPTPKQSNTPRTDAECLAYAPANGIYPTEFYYNKDGCYVSASFARKLELELVDAARNLRGKRK